MADLLFRDADVETLAAKVAAIVIEQLRPLLEEAREPRLVDRHRMAELLSISVPMLDRMTADEVIPCVRLGARRLYSPAIVIEALVTNEKAPAIA